MSGFLSESVFRNSVPNPPSTSLNLPFANSFGPPTPASNNLGIPFPVSGGTPFGGPTTFVNKSITQHFVTSYDVNGSKSVLSSQERVTKLKIGDLVFLRSRSGPSVLKNPEACLKFPTVPGATTVEMFNIVQLNKWLAERSYDHRKYDMEPGYYKNASELLQEFCFIGSIKNTVDSNGAYTSAYGNRQTSRMLNVVVSKRASVLNIFPYLTLASQELWFIIKKVDCEKNQNGKRDRNKPKMKRWVVIPWTDSDASRPTLKHLSYEDEEGHTQFGTCIHVGKALDTCVDYGNQDPSPKGDYENSCDRIANVNDRQQVYVRNNLEVFIKV